MGGVWMGEVHMGGVWMGGVCMGGVFVRARGAGVGEGGWVVAGWLLRAR